MSDRVRIKDEQPYRPPIVPKAIGRLDSLTSTRKTVSDIPGYSRPVWTIRRTSPEGTTPRSVMMPVMRLAGVTSKAGL